MCERVSRVRWEVTVGPGVEEAEKKGWARTGRVQGRPGMQTGQGKTDGESGAGRGDGGRRLSGLGADSRVRDGEAKGVQEGRASTPLTHLKEGGHGA